MIIPILFVPRHISPVHLILKPAHQSRRKHRRGIIQQIPLARIPPVPRAVQRRRTPRSHRTQQHIDHLHILAAERQHTHSIRVPLPLSTARPLQPRPHRIPMPRIFGPISIPLAGQPPDLRQTPRLRIRVVGQDEIGQRPHWFGRCCNSGILFGAAVAKVQAADDLPGFGVGVGGEGQDGDVGVGAQFGDESGEGAEDGRVRFHDGVVGQDADAEGPLTLGVGAELRWLVSDVGT